ncbi:iron-sulfur cluster assembly scaffold protein [Caulobacter sp. NIBR2454]|uniref:iron-sulfur cluster assembly scaffold protein n=1 Tax=Caulobacter sp. NIBR2454 TaxID=3015996 RepID=UPI0022B70046|nr:iron-sulfur cluster assembly scaffold protein [Caulobacter sp. NIBR2454]
MIDDLYSARVLALVADMPRAGRLPAPDASAEKVAKLCGSRITVDVTLDEQGRVADFAQDVQACALGQAAAAVLGAHVIGADLAELAVTRDALHAMLKSNGPAPQGRFSELSVLEPVKDYPARHASTLLAFEAALEAVQAAETARQKRDTTKARTSPAGAA